MKRPFILDMNVIQSAATLKDERGNEDLSAKKLLKEVAYFCNEIIIPHGYETRYIKKWSVLKTQRQFFGSEIFNLYNQLRMIQGKLNTPDEEPSPLIEEGQFHEDDKDFVRLAAHVDNGVILVTTDGRLKEKLKKLGMLKKYDFNVLRPEEAIRYVGETV
jgi:hypothetical protein